MYTTALLVLLALLLAPPRQPARADVDLAIEPAMTKGTSTAPVTIVEFSDYQ